MRNQAEIAHRLEIIVVDNDAAMTARSVVESIDAPTTSMREYRYVCEPMRNIAHARNAAVRHSSGDLIAFIDDDELPVRNWLRHMLETLDEYGCEGVLGPVVPEFEGEPADWLIRSGLATRESFATGTELRDTAVMRTGNVLMRRKAFQNLENPFDPSYGLTGGEDTAFFRVALQKGLRFVWCNEAVAKEWVPRDRQTARYYVKRACMRGVNNARNESVMGISFTKSIAAIMIYGVALPFLWLAGRHVFVRYLVKEFDHLSKVLAHAGIKLSRAREP